MGRDKHAQRPDINVEAHLDGLGRRAVRKIHACRGSILNDTTDTTYLVDGADNAFYDFALQGLAYNSPVAHLKLGEPSSGDDLSLSRVQNFKDRDDIPIPPGAGALDLHPEARLEQLLYPRPKGGRVQLNRMTELFL
jgi:hypothetical protein